MNNFSNAFSGLKLKQLFTLNTFKTHLVFQSIRHQYFNFGTLKHFSDTFQKNFKTIAPKNSNTLGGLFLKHQSLERCFNFPIKR